MLRVESRSVDSTSATPHASAPAARQSATARRLLAVVATIAVLSLAADTVLYARVVRRLKGREWFVSQLLYTASVNAATWPVVAALHCSGRLAPHNWRFPKWKMVAIAAMGTGGNLLGSFPATFLPGSLRAVVLQLATPFTMAQSRLLLGTRYSARHVAAAVVIVAAGVTAVVPRLSGGGAAGGGSYATGWAQALWLAVLLLFLCIPKGVYSEKWLKAANLNVWFFRAQYALFEAAIGLLLVPVVFIPIPGQTHVTPSALPSFMWGALRCFAGDESAAEPGGSCAGSASLWALFMAVNITSNIGYIAVYKYGSATLMAALGVLQLPLTAFLYLWPWLAGDAVEETVSWWTVAAVAVATFGIVLYNSERELSPQRTLSLASTGTLDGPGAEEDAADAGNNASELTSSLLLAAQRSA